MVNCPKCGTQATATKCWNLASLKKDGGQTVSEIRIGLFECEKCKHKFRAKVNSEEKKLESTDFSSLIEQLNKIKLELTNNLSKLKENIKKIRIFLGDQQLAAVAQAKVAKSKILVHRTKK